MAVEVSGHGGWWSGAGLSVCWGWRSRVEGRWFAAGGWAGLCFVEDGWVGGVLQGGLEVVMCGC